MRPLVVHIGAAWELADELAQLRRGGWSLHDGWYPPRHGFRVVDPRVVCHGPVVDAGGAAAAVLAAARGAGVVAAVGAAAGLAERVYEDLTRFGAVRTRALSVPARETAALIDPAAQALFAALARGETLKAAACSLSISTRTADRRVATARRQLGVSTTAEALAKLASGQPVGMPSPARTGRIASR
jgi:hypothetical protein